MEVKDVLIVARGVKRGPGTRGHAVWACALKADGKDIEVHGAYIGSRVTLHVAHYHAILRALELALKAGYERIQIEAGSNLTAGQLQGTVPVLAPHLNWFVEEIKRLSAKGSVTFLAPSDTHRDMHCRILGHLPRLFPAILPQELETVEV